MSLTLLLNAINLIFKFTYFRDPNFKKFIVGHEYKLVIKTRDDRYGKRFIFTADKLTTDNNFTDYDAAMIWESSLAGFIALLQAESGTMAAMKRHKVVIDGKLCAFQWFNAAINYALGKLK